MSFGTFDEVVVDCFHRDRPRRVPINGRHDRLVANDETGAFVVALRGRMASEYELRCCRCPVKHCPSAVAITAVGIALPTYWRVQGSKVSENSNLEPG